MRIECRIGALTSTNINRGEILDEVLPDCGSASAAAGAGCTVAQALHHRRSSRVTDHAGCGGRGTVLTTTALHRKCCGSRASRASRFSSARRSHDPRRLDRGRAGVLTDRAGAKARRPCRSSASPGPFFTNCHPTSCPTKCPSTLPSCLYVEKHPLPCGPEITRWIRHELRLFTHHRLRRAAALCPCLRESSY